MKTEPNTETVTDDPPSRNYGAAVTYRWPHGYTFIDHEAVEWQCRHCSRAGHPSAAHHDHELAALVADAYRRAGDDVLGAMWDMVALKARRGRAA